MADYASLGNLKENNSKWVNSVFNIKIIMNLNGFRLLKPANLLELPESCHGHILYKQFSIKLLRGTTSKQFWVYEFELHIKTEIWIPAIPDTDTAIINTKKWHLTSIGRWQSEQKCPLFS